MPNYPTVVKTTTTVKKTKKKKGRRSGARLDIGGSGKLTFPERTYKALNLYVLPSITSSAGSFATTGIYKASFPGDFQGAHGSVKPRYWNELINTSTLLGLYETGHCYACKVKVTFAGAEKQGDVGIAFWDSEDQPPESMKELGERPYCWQKYLGVSDRSVVTFKKYIKFPAILGITRKQYLSEDEYEFTTSSPTHYIGFGAFYQAYAGQTSSVQIKIQIRFYCKFDQLKDVPDS